MGVRYLHFVLDYTASGSQWPTYCDTVRWKCRLSLSQHRGRASVWMHLDDEGGSRGEVGSRPTPGSAIQLVDTVHRYPFSVGPG